MKPFTRNHIFCFLKTLKLDYSKVEMQNVSGVIPRPPLKKERRKMGLGEVIERLLVFTNQPVLSQAGQHWLNSNPHHAQPESQP